MNLISDSYLLSGGARSGKSRFALQLALSASKPFYIASGWAGDEEMEERIRKHRAERGPAWTTIESQINIPQALLEASSKGADFIVVDCLTLWTSNILCQCKENAESLVSELIKTIPQIKVPLVFVTNEVGSGIVPGDPMSREFRDLAGFINQKVAAAVANVYLCVCGIPLKIK